MNINSPIVKRLRSNKNYKASNLVSTSKNKQANIVAENDFQTVVEQLCHSETIIEQIDNETIDDFFSKLDIEDFCVSNDNSDCSKSSKSQDSLVDQINNLNLNSDFDSSEEAWYLSHSQRKGYKLYSFGCRYTVEKPKQEEVINAEKVYWRCEKYPDCKGRAISKGLIPPLNVTKSHNHEFKTELKDELKALNELKANAIQTNDPPRVLIQKLQTNLTDQCIVSLPKKEAIRQLVLRTRNTNAGKGYNAKSIAELEIPESLQTTIKGKKFYYGDSRKNDKNRIIFFTTDENLKLLSTNNDWYMDGTFDISPTIFKQVFSIHINFRGTTLPMLYALLPNKKQTTYKKLFKMILKLITKKPNSVNCDFELAAINAARLVFECEIYGCFFHLSQSFWRRIQQDGLKNWFKDDKLRITFRKTQALAFVPVEDVKECFKMIKDDAPRTATSFLTYIENNYVGSDTKKSRFPLEFWNLYNRVKLQLPRTNNSIESWHSRISRNTCQNLTIKKVIDLFKEEQNTMEADLVLLFSGKCLKVTNSKVEKREQDLKRTIDAYNRAHMGLFLNGLANLINDKIYNHKNYKTKSVKA